MKKKEFVYRALLEHVIARKTERITQLGLSKSLGMSISTVNNALLPLRQMDAVRIKPAAIVVADAQKIAAYLASARKLQKDVIYRTRVASSASEIEKSMPAGAIFTAHSAYRLAYGEVPSDYGEVYVYAEPAVLEEIMRRFPQKAGPANLIALKCDEELLKMAKKSCAPASQIYADLWNIGTWQANEFLRALEGRFGWQSSGTNR